MAMVLDALASYLGNLLTQMAKDEVGMLLGVSDEVKKMEAMLRDIENFLADAEKRRITDRSVAGWVRELKDVMYDASDILDICQLKVEERRPSTDGMGSGCCNSLLLCLRDPRFAHRIGTQMKALNQKLQDISERSAQFKFINLGSYEDHRAMVTSSRDVNREMGSVFIQEDIVGEKIEQDTRMLVEMLTKEEDNTRRMSRGNTMVIAILGTGGIGKTTLIPLVSPTERDELEVESLRETGMKIIEKYDGLPLAIKLVGGLLCKKNRNKGVWEEVSQDPAWSNTGLPEELNNAVYLSCEYLSSTLKQCFIYYSLLSKDEVIYHGDVVYMWIVEEFVRDDGSSKQLEVLGAEYYKVVMRNLLEPVIGHYDQCYCIMHDVVRSFALYVARDEVLVVREGQSISSIASSKYCHLSLSNEIVEWSTLQKQESLRTLMLFGGVNVKRGNSQSILSCLQILHVNNADFTKLLGSMCHLKHLRYLALNETDISKLPDDIGKMKFLQYINVSGCPNLVGLPRSITKLERLRHLDIRGTGINAIPKGFGRLKNLVMLLGFPVHTVDNVTNWGSLEEIGSLSQLMILTLECLENVSHRSMATCANLGSKMHLIELRLDYNASRMTTHDADQQCIEEVLDELCPPLDLEILCIQNNFGHRVPRWMMSTRMLLRGNLRFLQLEDLTCCIHLPDGLAQLPNLDYLDITNAPCIQHIGHEFLFLPSSSCSSSLLGSGMDEEKRIDISTNSGRKGRDINIENSISQATAVAFPRLRKLFLYGIVEWKEWDWEEQVKAMPSLQLLDIRDCNLRLLPPGLSYHARHLKELCIVDVKHLSSIENFLYSVVELVLNSNPDLERITNLAKMQKLTIEGCEKLKELEGVEAHRSIELWDYEMETLPGYLQDARQVTKLEIHCSLELLKAISMRGVGSEWDKINHVQQLKAYAPEGDYVKRWYFLYTRDDAYNVFFDTNIDSTYT